ncbi:MAG: hypothetical protein PF501_08050 [Salinisphaera sp.]|nr:hypothetical protein [Salinisphaera sp.]
MRFNNRSIFITTPVAALAAAVIACAGFSTVASAASTEQDMSPASAYRFQHIGYSAQHPDDAKLSAASAAVPAALDQGPGSEHRFDAHAFSGSQLDDSKNRAMTSDHGAKPGPADVAGRNIGRAALFAE